VNGERTRVIVFNDGIPYTGRRERVSRSDL
jgi:hypothetical protein